MWKAAQGRPPVLTISHSHFPLFSPIVAKCEKLLSRPHIQCSLLVFTEAWSASMLKVPASKKCYLMTSGSLALLQIDLWAVKDGQINVFCILDRIRVSGTCGHLHIPWLSTLALCFWLILIDFCEGLSPFYILLFFSCCWRWHGCVGLRDLVEIIPLGLTSSS